MVRAPMTDDLLEDDIPVIPNGYRRMDWFRGFGRQIGPLYERIGTRTEAMHARFSFANITPTAWAIATAAC